MQNVEVVENMAQPVMFEFFRVVKIKRPSHKCTKTVIRFVVVIVMMVLYFSSSFLNELSFLTIKSSERMCTEKWRGSLSSPVTSLPL
jgi:hypothetical protein